MSKWENNEEIQLFREYLKIPSVHPDVDYEPCEAFLKKQAESLGLSYSSYCPAHPKKPVVILTWIGTDPSLPAIMLNSHMDVVPVFEEKWTHPPFAADITENGNIYARGSQDMKCVGMQYLAAIRYFKKNGITFKRTIHLSFVPDEEIGGKPGMAAFAKTDDFKKLNIGFSLDEGIASETDTFSVFYAERSIWHITFTCNGPPGHGSLLLKNTAGEKVRYITDKMMDLRRENVLRLENNPELTIGDVTTVNMTILSGGKQDNVIPPYLCVTFDVRLAIDVDHKAFLAQLEKWCDEAGDTTMSFTQKEPRVEPTKIDDSNPYWMAFKSAVDELGIKIKTMVFTGGTDSRYVRDLGIPAIGFSPMNNTPVLLHDNDEFLNADVYLRGIEMYKTIIPKVANV